MSSPTGAVARDLKRTSLLVLVLLCAAASGGPALSEQNGSLTIRGPRLGNEIFLGANADSSPGARFYQDGVPRLILGTTSGLRVRDPLQARFVSSFLLLDEAGRVVYSTPDAVKP